MDAKQVEALFREALNIRIGGHTAEYVARRWDAGEAIPVMGGDARTGRAVRTSVPPAELARLAALARQPVPQAARQTATQTPA